MYIKKNVTGCPIAQVPPNVIAKSEGFSLLFFKADVTLRIRIMLKKKLFKRLNTCCWA